MTDEPPIRHLATKGLPAVAVVIEHPVGECAWCDAERWRAIAEAYVHALSVPGVDVGLLGRTLVAVARDLMATTDVPPRLSVS